MIKARTILLVEDEPSLRDELAELLITLGFRCLATDNGAAAFDVLKCERVDLLLCDVNLAGEDGLNLIRRMHGELGEIFTRIAVIVMTGHTALVESQCDNMDHLISAFLLKPIRLRDLRALLDSLIGEGVRDVA
ncbi:Response regulator receiver domain-containing protein [Sphingomonas gellani]|uniref:Response regulator receiver domain-containing protein n=1 Tax=Sphingomonas gellani TaxID=1166340 RepID=A0A1H8JFP6_9SPHN|nr:response regulator [Sphingomonas gellani]SEN79245.1 Response regulator receiver domain-containing protein [Sphingomonas gellani]